jgi:uncharacterized RDD family membrane protein YckC
MFCPHCGVQVVEGIRFCPVCGKEIAGSLTAEAPGVGVPAKYGGFWVRFVAIFIDGVVLAIPTWILFGAAFFSSGILHNLTQGEMNDPQAAVMMMRHIVFPRMMGAWLGLIIVQWLYFALMESSPRQATLGKMAMSLRVADLEGRRISFGRATGRFFLKAVSNFFFMFGIGLIDYIVAGFTPKKQALHDMIAGTLVFRAS